MKIKLLLISALLVVFGNCRAESFSAIRFLVVSPGEDASTEVGVSWHCETSGSTLEIALADDVDFAHAWTYAPYETPWSLAQGDSLFQKQRLVCRVNLCGLVPDAEYNYRVRARGEVCAVGSFRTAPSREVASAKSVKIISLIDYQPAFNDNTHPLIDRLLEIAPDACFATCSGDFTDYGSKEAEWAWAMDSEIYSRMMFASTPGDHEYWGIKGPQDEHVPQMVEPFGFNAIFNNPSNGAPLARNSSWFFHYGNILFIGLDMSDSNTVECDKFESEARWFNEVIARERGTYDILIVQQHKSMYGSDETDSRVSKVLRPIWTEIFRSAGVDLVISGHDHKYSRTRLVDGTFYLDMGSSGRKYRKPEEALYTDGIHEKVMDFIPDKNCVGAVIEVLGPHLKVSVIDKSGSTLDSFEK